MWRQFSQAGDVFLKFDATLDDATKTQIKMVMQNEFTQAMADLTVTCDPERQAGADRIVCFVNDFSPDRNRWGDSGDGKTVKVYLKEFTDDPVVSPQFDTAAKLGNGLGETGAHEVGHTYGLNHNWDNPPSKMTEGSKVGAAARAADNRAFNDADKLILRINTNPGILDLIPRPKGDGSDVAVVAYETPTPVPLGKLEYTPWVDAGPRADGPLADAFYLGYLVHAVDGSLTFGLRSPLTGPQVAQAITLANGDLVQWALAGREGTPFQGQIFPIGDFGQLQFSDPVTNPYIGDIVYRQLFLTWSIRSGNDVFVFLDAQRYLPGTTNGFQPYSGGHANPEPGALTLLTIGLAGLAGYAWRWRKQIG
jgi:hypothetical protein